MAWFRAGGGGIPSSLKSDMNDVFNKKFGTVLQNYPPDEWPADVNLMGPLPERTVSGSVVAFADGADDVPLKSCAVTIAPTLDGVSSVNVVSAGKNLFTDENKVNGYLNVDGDLVSATGWFVTDYIRIAPSTEYTFTSGSSAGASPRTILYDKSKTMVQAINTGNRTFTTHASAYYIRISYRSTDTDIQLEIGSSSTDYAPHISTTHTANLGRTIYGGSVDVVNGTGTETAGKAVFTGSETWQLYSNETFWYTTLTADNIKTLQNCTTSNGVVVLYQSTNGQLRVYLSSNVGVVDTTTDMNALLSNGVSFAYPYETPEAFTFDPVPIDSRYGDNTIWSDNGDLEVTYRRDIDLALAQ